MTPKDLVVLAADKDIEHALIGLFSRPQALNIHNIDVDVFVHPQHDPACARRGVEFLASFAKRYRHALLIFDHEGSGLEHVPPHELQMTLNGEFQRSIWKGKGKAIILRPELEAWIWSPSPQVDRIIGWDIQPSLRRWMIENDLLLEGEAKPERPKEAFHRVLYEAGTPRSSSIYQQIAERVSLQRCVDESFLEFKSTLREWFPVPET